MTLVACWTFWTLIVISNTVVFLNFLIAVISDVYEQVMETRVEEVYQNQATLVVEVSKALQKKKTKGMSSKILMTRMGVVVKGKAK